MSIGFFLATSLDVDGFVVDLQIQKHLHSTSLRDWTLELFKVTQTLWNVIQGQF